MAMIRKVICAMSGGVDSSVAAYLLKNKGFEVTGVYMRNWDLNDDDGTCAADADAEDAEYVCKKIGIPFRHVSFVREYWTEVFTEFIDDYERGLTPNPDIMCNKRIKFDTFYNYAINTLSGDAIATGHYANTSFGSQLEFFDANKRAYLLRGVDHDKDQSFFLSQISQESLRKTMFPIGRLKKNRVKAIAVEANLHRIAKKNESMGICFIGANNYQKFIKNYICPRPGNFIDAETGNIVGTHDGIHLWTIGQKCSIGGKPHAYYVVRKGVNDIIVVPGTHHPALYSKTLVTSQPHWIHSSPLDETNSLECKFCFQHRNPLAPCTVYQTKDSRLKLALHVPLRALTPGQFAVFYSDEICHGSARILSVGPSLYRNELLLLGNKCHKMC